MGYEEHYVFYNQYGHHEISCSGIRRRSEIKPYGDRAEIVRSLQTLRGNRTTSEPLRFPYDHRTILGGCPFFV